MLDEYENTQYIDISKIKCEQCLIKNKSETYNNEFYRCCNCNKNICPLCKSNHDKNHNIINYDIKNYICEKHNESFVEYCNDCKIDICLSCENEHINHNKTHYKNIMKDMNKLKNEMNEYKREIDIFINDINDIINKLNKIKENILIYYNIYNNIIKYNESKKRNYIILQNINEINNNIIKDINKINNCNDINNKFNDILNKYNKIMNIVSEINIIYNLDYKLEINFFYEVPDEIRNKKKIKIFGNKFVENNKNKCKMIIDNKEYELMSEYNIENYKI